MAGLAMIHILAACCSRQRPHMAGAELLYSCHPVAWAHPHSSHILQQVAHETRGAGYHGSGGVLAAIVNYCKEWGLCYYNCVLYHAHEVLLAVVERDFDL